MKVKFQTLVGLLILLVTLLSLTIASLTAIAGAPMPKIPKGNAKQCVEETEFMRKNHMELLLHQRDETVHNGIRTKKHSLKECISCHVVKNNNIAVNITNPKHFCRECHDYASVKIDCFECHASKPRPTKTLFTILTTGL